MSHMVDVLIPTYRRAAALAVTLAGVCSQQFRSFRVVISDQTEDSEPTAGVELQTLMRVLRSHGNQVEVYKHLPRRGMAEQRQFLLDQTLAPYALFLDDDIYLEPWVLGNMVKAITEQGCGLVGMAVIGLSHVYDVRPHEQAIEFWEGRVGPEVVRPNTPAWQRHKLHNAANIYHAQQRLGLTPDQQRCYHVAWVGACAMYDVAKLRAAGAYSFWPRLPAEHCGEDVYAQLKVIERYGGCGLIPSGAYHQEFATTMPAREVNAPEYLAFEEKAAEKAAPASGEPTIGLSTENVRGQNR